MKMYKAQTKLPRKNVCSLTARSLGDASRIIIIMEIYKVSTLRLKALIKHTHIMYIEMVNVIPPKKRRKKEDIDKGL